MRFLIITSDTNTLKQAKAFLIKYFGETSRINSASNLHDAAEQIIKFQPQVIIANTTIEEQSALKLVEHLPPNENRYYFFVDINKHKAIKAIRLGVNGMFDLSSEQPQLANAIENLSEQDSINRLEYKLKNLKRTEPENKSLIIQINSGFKQINYSDLLYVEALSNKVNFGLKHSEPFESNHELFIVANNLPYEQFSVVTPKLIINTSNVAHITPEEQGCLIHFDDKSKKQVVDINLDVLSGMISENQIINRNK